VDYQPKVSSEHACRHLRRHISHRTTRYQPTILTWTASYDSRDRLTALVRSNTSSRYQYDANSNRLTSVAQTIADTNGNATFEALDTAANTAQALSIEGSSNRLLGFTQSITSVRGTQTLSTVNSAVNYSLDAAGNLASDGLRAFAYDATNRHTSTRSPAGADTANVQYLFNALGQRVFKSTVALSSGTVVVSGGTTATGSITPMPTLGQFYSYADDSDSAGSGSSSASLPSYAMLGEYCNGASGCVQQEYLWLPLDNGQAIPIGLLKSSRLYAIHTDHLGTPRLIHDDSNTPVWQWAYSAFGENAPTGALKATTNVNSVFALGANNAKLALSAPGITVNLRFAGQYADSESNLFQNGYRSYAPAIGSYSQMDPIGLSGGMNRRGYAYGNSLAFIDPVGLQVPGTWRTVFGGTVPEIKVPQADYTQFGYSGPFWGAAVTLDRNHNAYFGVNTGCIACEPSLQLCYGNVKGAPMSPAELSDFISGAGGQASLGQFGIGYGWAFSGGRTASQVTFGAPQAPGAGAAGYTWKVYSRGKK
jgi:RHS repeat-associated protein